MIKSERLKPSKLIIKPNVEWQTYWVSSRKKCEKRKQWVSVLKRLCLLWNLWMFI